MARKRSLLNINVPKVGRVTSQTVLKTMVGFGIGMAVWNYSSDVPYIGPYADRGKALILRILGFGSGVGAIRTRMVA